MWFAVLMLAVFAVQRYFFAPTPYTGQFDMDEGEYDYR